MLDQVGQCSTHAVNVWPTWTMLDHFDQTQPVFCIPWLLPFILWDAFLGDFSIPGLWKRSTNSAILSRVHALDKHFYHLPPNTVPTFDCPWYPYLHFQNRDVPDDGLCWKRNQSFWQFHYAAFTFLKKTILWVSEHHLCKQRNPALKKHGTVESMIDQVGPCLTKLVNAWPILSNKRQMTQQRWNVESGKAFSHVCKTLNVSDTAFSLCSEFFHETAFILFQSCESTGKNQCVIQAELVCKNDQKRWCMIFIL
jgi:hypothetical protein